MMISLLLEGRPKMGGLFVITVVIALPVAFILALALNADSIGEALGCLGITALAVLAYCVIVVGGFSFLLHSCSA